MAALMPQGKQQYFTAGGIPLVGGKVYTYAAGTTTPLATYTDAAAGTPNANPVILDSRGEASIFFSAANYKIVVKDSLDSTIWTQDNLAGDAAGKLRTDLAASTGSANVGHIASGAGAVATTVQGKLRESVSVTDFGAVGDDATDNSAAFALAKAYIDSLSTPCELVFPPGIYRTSTDQNWFKQDLTITASGKVTIKSSAASGNVMSVDAGTVANGYKFQMLGNFFLDTVSGGAQYGLYTRNVNQSTFEVSVRNVSVAGVKIDGAVLNSYKISCTVNPDAMSTTPVNGVIVDGSGILSSSADCKFELIIEGVSGNGLVLTKVSDSTFTGTSEGNGGLGIYLATNATRNVFINFFMEANLVSGDIDCYGKSNRFISCTSSSRAAGSPFEAVKSIKLRAGSELNVFSGGYLYAADVEAGALQNRFEDYDCAYAIADAGTGTQITNTRQLFNTSTIVRGFTVGNVANSSPVVLDWYEEGNFTPTFGGSTADGSLTTDIQSGIYTRTGNIVNFSLLIRVATLTTTPTGDLQIRGLPFACAASPAQQSVIVGNWSNLTLPASRTDLTAYIPSGTTYIRLIGCASGLASSIVQGSGLAATLLAISGSYTV